MPEILQLDQSTIEQFVSSFDKLKQYEFDLKLINEKRPHILDADTEKLLTEAQDALSTPSNVYGMFSNADLEFEDAIDKDGEAHPLRYFYKIFRV